MYTCSKIILGCSFSVISYTVVAASAIGSSSIQAAPNLTVCGERCDGPIILAAKKLSPPQVVKIGPKGKQENMTKSEFRSKYPNGFKLYKSTERAAIAFQATGGGKVPSHCTSGPQFFSCQVASWYCRVSWFNGHLSGQCHVVPPAPDPQ